MWTFTDHLDRQIDVHESEPIRGLRYHRFGNRRFEVRRGVIVPDVYDGFCSWGHQPWILVNANRPKARQLTVLIHEGIHAACGHKLDETHVVAVEQALTGDLGRWLSRLRKLQ